MDDDFPTPLDVIYENWGRYNKKLQTCVARLKNADLSLQPAPGMWPLGQILQHIVSVRAGWFSYTLSFELAGLSEKNYQVDLYKNIWRVRTS